MKHSKTESIEIDQLRESLKAKLSSALNFLGERWVLHPKYEYDSKHNQNGYDTGKFKIKAPE